MNKKLKFKRPGSGVDITSYTPDVGEPLYDPIRKQLRVGDASTPGGIIPREMSYSAIVTPPSYTAKPDEIIPADCSSGSVTIRLPLASICDTGTTVRIYDITNSAGSTIAGGGGEAVISVDGNGSKINQDSSEPFHIDVPGACIDFVYFKSLNNWFVSIGGVVFPSGIELDFTDELGIDPTTSKIGINQVDANKVVGDIDGGSF